ncbi:MAG: CoA transferase [Actinomycetota bacterium]
MPTDPSAYRSDGVLADVKVVEFAQNAAVPQCGRLLAGMGADVVKVEPIKGDAMRGLAELAPREARAFAVINPGKRGISLDLAAPGANDVVDRLVAWADVCLVGLKAADVERFGLGWERVRAINPRLVQLVLTAFGPVGPDAKEGGYDVLVQGASGLGLSMARTRDGTPLPVRPAMFDFSTGNTAAAGVIAALRHRDATGLGQRVDASLLGTAMTLGTPLLASFPGDDRAIADIEDSLSELRAAGVDFETQRDVYEAQVVSGGGVFRIYFRHYQTADGLISVAGMSPGLVAKFHEITGIDGPPNLIDQSTPEFQSVVDEAEALFRTRTTDEWMATLRAANYPCARFNFHHDAIAAEQAVANDYVVDLEHPTFGEYRTVGMPFRFDATPTAVAEPSPRLGEHTREVLAELGFVPTAVDTLHADGVVRSFDA